MLVSYLEGDICQLNKKLCSKPRVIKGEAIKAKDGTPCLQKLIPDCLKCEIYISKIIDDRLKDIKD